MNTIFENVRTDRQFSATTGYTQAQFYSLVTEYAETENQFFESGLLPPNFPATLQKVEERLFFALYYFTYPHIKPRKPKT